MGLTKKKNKMKKTLTLISTILLVTSCATVFSGSTQRINFKVLDSNSGEDLTGFVCKVYAPGGQVDSIVSSPSSVVVARGDGAIRVDCKKDGYKQGSMAVGDSFNAVSVVNVLFWPGFLVDLASGAYKKYPSHYVVNMEKISK